MGCTHEQEGIRAYQVMADKNHENVIVSIAGCFIDVTRPYIGTSSDGIVSSNCCGRGVIEVKCPFCVKHGVTRR